MIQHADERPALQRKALPLLRAAVAAGEADGSNLALLEDRVAVADGRPQRYGTQGRCEGTKWKPFIVEDPVAALDKRRASVGLETQASYEASITRLFCDASATDASKPSG
jgi:hypothetical protein